MRDCMLASEDVLSKDWLTPEEDSAWSYLAKERDMSVIQLLLRSRKFWLAVFGLVQTIVFSLIPEFPADVWQAIDALVIVLISAIAAEDVAQKRAGNA